MSKNEYLKYLQDHSRHLFSVKTEEKIGILVGIIAFIILLYKLINDIIPNVYKAIILKNYHHIWKVFI